MYTFAFAAVRRIADLVREEPSIERGGLLFGCGDLVLFAAGAPNEAAHPENEFAIGDRHQATLIDAFATEPLDLLGSFHSHPNGRPEMSGPDAALAQALGPLLIVAPGKIWVWRLFDPVAGGAVNFAIAPPLSLTRSL